MEEDELSMMRNKNNWDLSIEERIKKAEKNKEDGNALFKEGKTEQALENYSKAIKLLIPIYKPTENIGATLQELKKSLYLNISACQLRLKQFDFVVANCSKVLDISKDNIKALYRRSVAYTELDRIDEAQEDVTNGLKIDEQNTALMKQLQIVQNKMKKFAEKDSRVMKSYMSE